MRLSHHVLNIGNPADTGAFYRQRLGMSLVESRMQHVRRPDGWLLGTRFLTPRLDELVAGLGVRFAASNSTGAQPRMAIANDLDGYALRFTET